MAVILCLAIGIFIIIPIAEQNAKEILKFCEGKNGLQEFNNNKTLATLNCTTINNEGLTALGAITSITM